MKLFKNYLIIILFFFINPMHAKQISRPAVIPVQPTIPQPTQQQRPQIQPQPVQPKRTATFREHVTAIKNIPTHVVWNNANKSLQPDFINSIITDAKAANFTQNQVEVLLIIARDSHAQFTGNNAQDAQILVNINNQINNAIAKL